jgi:hypothetical protein
MENRNHKPSLEEVQSWPVPLQQLELSMLCDSPVPLVAQQAQEHLFVEISTATPQLICQLWEEQERAQAVV